MLWCPVSHKYFWKKNQIEKKKLHYKPSLVFQRIWPHITLILHNIFTFTVKVKKILNACFACSLFHVVVVIIYLPRTFLAPNKHWVHFPVLDINFLNFPFSMSVPPIVSFKTFVSLEGCHFFSWNSSRRFLLVWRILHFFQTTSVRFSKNRLHVKNNGTGFKSYRWFSWKKLFITTL